MSWQRVLVVDDDPLVQRGLSARLRQRELEIVTEGTLETARESLMQDDFDAIFLDLRLPDGNGITLLQQLDGVPDAPAVVVMTGYGSFDSALQCVQLGAVDYLLKPFSPAQIDGVVMKGEAVSRLRQQTAFLTQAADGIGKELLGESRAIVRMREMISQVASTTATVLVFGESGTGKELVAAAIHEASDRAKHPFVRVNCAAISESLIESEFFGHEKGAFTGATQRRAGRFELADGGTLLLDEISEISPALQAKLLRVLQEREFERVGGSRTIRVDVRVIATTNRDLLREVKEGRFRADLYYRLNVFPIASPPLRERNGDIIILARHFLGQARRQMGSTVDRFAPSALEALVNYAWPGNVRELRNCIERAAILASHVDSVQVGHLQLPGVPVPSALRPEIPTSLPVVPAHEPALPQLEPLTKLEQRTILHALQTLNGNRTRVAKELGISLRTLRNKLAQYREAGVDVPAGQVGQPQK